MAKKEVKKIYKIKKVTTCPLKDKYDQIDYKNVQLLKKFISTRGRIFPPARTGVSPKCQRKLQQEIKKARYMSLLPFTQYV